MQSHAAIVPLQLTISLGDLPSRALEVLLLMDGREGFAKNRRRVSRTFKLAEEGARLDCHHCEVMYNLLVIDLFTR